MSENNSSENTGSDSSSSEYAVKLPDIGEGVAEAEVVEWLVAVGDEVRRDQPLAEVMTDKASVEITAPIDGAVLRLGGTPGEFVAVGSDLVVLTVDGEVPDAHRPNAPMPDSGKPDPEPVTAEPVPPAAPAPAVAPVASVASVPVREAQPAAVLPASGKPLASPPVRKRARLAGVELAAVAGSGPRGRVTHADLDAYLDPDTVQTSIPTDVGAPPIDASPPSDASLPGSGSLAGHDVITEVPLAGLRRRIAAQMSLAKSQIPHITYVEEIDVTALEELRSYLNTEALSIAKPGVPAPKLTLLPLIVAAVRRALASHPEMNATFDDSTDVISQHSAFHCGVAVDTPKGLVVPVVRHADTFDIWGLAGEIGRLADGARSGSLTSDELRGSTFTISSLGRLGGVVTTPVVNHPEVAILGVNKVVERPVVVDGEIVVRKMMNLSGSFDHRIVDGMDVALFVQKIKAALEHPASIFVSLPPTAQ